MVRTFNPNLASRIALLQDRSLANEQASELDCFRKGSTTVVAQIDQYAVDLGLLEVSEQAFNVPGGAPVTLVTRMPGGKVFVKGRQRYHADAPLGCAVREGLYGGFRSLLLQVDRFANQRNDFVFPVNTRLRRQDIQPDSCVCRTTNQGNRVVRAPAHDVQYGAVFALADADDSVADLQLARTACRATRNKFSDEGVIIGLGKHGAYANQ